MKVREVALDEIKVSDRIREEMGDVEELAESISLKGLIQPITLDESYNLVAGGRRYAAFQHLGKRKISAIIRRVEGTLDAREIELFENLHRKNLTWQEEANALTAIHELMVEQHGKEWGVRRTAQLLNKSKSTISTAVNMTKAMVAVPELADMPTADKARRKLNRLIEETRIVAALKEVKDTRGHVATYAQSHFVIGDAIEGLMSLHEGTRHFAEVDPPYAIELKKHRENAEDIHHYNEVSAREYPAFIKRVAEAVFRSLRDDTFCVWWYGPTWHHMVDGVLRSVGFKVDDIPAIWYKINTGTISGNPDTYLARSYEPFLVCRKGSPKIRQKNRDNVFAFPGVPSNNRIHPTERPIDLIRDILKTFTYPKAHVIVPFLGSGNTLISCYHEGMLGMGWDLSEEYKRGFITRVHKQFDKEFVDAT